MYDTDAARGGIASVASVISGGVRVVGTDDATFEEPASGHFSRVAMVHVHLCVQATDRRGVEVAVEAFQDVADMRVAGEEFGADDGGGIVGGKEVPVVA
jgi:hypothetical protein